MASDRTRQQDIHSFALVGLLPAGEILIVNQSLGTVACLSSHLGLPKMLREQQFAPAEISLLLPLLQSYPHYCPYEVLLASFNTSSVDEAQIAASRERLWHAQRKGTWDQEMRPVRNALSRTRLKVQHLGLDIISLFETGYILLPLAPAYNEKRADTLQPVSAYSA